MTGFALSMDVLVFKDTATGKYAAIGASFKGNRLTRCVELVDNLKEADTYSDQKEIDRLPEETRALLSGFSIVTARLTISR